MIEFHKTWIDPCAAAKGIRDRFGTEKALGYLIGEKLVTFVRAADTRPEFARELPSFIDEVKRIFDSEEIRKYLGRIRGLGPTAHIGFEAEIRSMREGGMFGEEDRVEDAEGVLVVERIKEMLLG